MNGETPPPSTWQKSQELAQAIIDSLHAHVCVLEDNGTLLAVNQAWRDFAAANPPISGNIEVGADYLAVCDVATGPDAETARAFAAGIRAVIADTRTQFELEYPCHSPQQQRWFVGRVTRLAGGTSSRVVIAHENITERKEVEEALRQGEQRYRSLFAYCRDAVMTLEPPTWKFTAGNPATVAMFGTRDAEHFVSLGPWELSPEQQPDGRASGEKAKEMIETAMRDGSHFFEWTHRRFNGESFPATVLLSRMETDGKAFLQATVRDITESKQTEAALRAARQFIEGIINAIPVRIFWKDKNLVYLGCNAVFAHDAGFADPQDIIGKDDYQLLPAQAELYRADDREVITSGCAKLLLEEPQTTPDGKIITLLTSKIPLRDGQGEINGVIGAYMDITERKQMEAAMQAKTKELEQFTYAVSHDLRSPLVTIQTFLGYLEQDMATADAGQIAKDVNFICTAANKMEELLTELGELSRVGRQMNTPEDVSLPAIVNEALALVAGRIAQRGVQVVVTETPTVLHGDRARLVAVFQNLVDNACKFMGDQKDPRIEIGVETRGAETVFFVRDNGSGIETGQQEKLFGLFVRLNPQVEGSGIGLALVKRIIEVHGGKIWVESKGIGQGTCLYFTLPGVVKNTNEGEKS